VNTFEEFNPQAEAAEEERKERDGIGGMLAVKGTSFGVQSGEVFTLLGVNGAGKSSTFKCLVGIEPISGGKLLLENVDLTEINHDPTKLHGLVGYCPQTDCIEGDLTVKETI